MPAWSERGVDATPALARPTPSIKLLAERILVDCGSGLATSYEEVEAPVIQLRFLYPGGLWVAAADPSERIFGHDGDRVFVHDRDVAAEAQARYLLESFGAVEAGCIDTVGTLPDSRADYILHTNADLHAIVSFSAYALPQLEALGWHVEIDTEFPWSITTHTSPWYARVAPDGEEDDWFSLELGIEVDGRRISLLPALVELLDGSPDQSSLASLTRIAKKFVALPLEDGRYVPVPTERLRSVVKVLLELYQEGGWTGDGVRFAGAGAAALTGLDAAFTDEADTLPLRWEGDTEIRDRGLALAAGPVIAPVTPPALLRATLRPYQEEGLSWLQHLRAHDAGGVLADDMGLGKTLQTIAHLAAEKAAGRMDRPSLVIAPTSLVGNWKREIKKFAPHLSVLVQYGPKRHRHWGELVDHDIVITTYPLLVRDQELFAERAFHYLILDEAQTIKNTRSLAHRAVKRVPSRHRLCLTGTPVENNLEELWALFDFLTPGLLGDAERFRSSFRIPIERDGKTKRLEALRQRVAPYILRRMKDTVAKDLPPKTEIVRPVELDGAQRELYESIRVAAHANVRRTIRKKGMAASTITILDALMKLRQVCCDPRLVRVQSAHEVKESAKYAMLFELLATQLEQGRRALIFSQFTTMLELISAGLQERSIRHVSLTGSTPDRQKMCDIFESGAVDVFLISLKAGGTGLNLTSADTVIHYDPWWNPAAQAQATDRAYRIGQTKPVFVYNLIVAGSVEERMLRLQRKKRHLADSILGQASEGATGSFTEGELEELLAPLTADCE